MAQAVAMRRDRSACCSCSRPVLQDCAERSFWISCLRNQPMAGHPLTSKVRPMIDRHAFADRIGAPLFETAETRMGPLLAEYGVSHPRDLPRAVAGEIFARAVVETAAADFPTADLEQLAHGSRAFAHPAVLPARYRVKSLTATGSDAFLMASGVDAAVVLAGFGLPVAPFDWRTSRTIDKASNDIDTVLALVSRHKAAYVG